MGSWKAFLKRAVIGAGIGAGAGMVAGVDWKKAAIVGAVVGLAGEPVKTMLVDAIVAD